MPMTIDLETLANHDLSDDCAVCRAQDVVSMALIPAAAAWELANELPRFSIALHGAASLLGTVVSAFGIAQSQSILEFFLSGSMAKVITLLTVVGILMFRPQGLFASKVRR